MSSFPSSSRSHSTRRKMRSSSPCKTASAMSPSCANVSAQGRCSPAWFAGRRVTVEGQVGEELRAAGQTVMVSGEVGGDWVLSVRQSG